MTELSKENCDFSCWVIKYERKTINDLTYKKDCLKAGNTIVPLLWNHTHFSPGAVLGRALLEHRDDGVYVYGYFNDSERWQLAKRLCQNEVMWISPFVTGVKYKGKNVVHGRISEVSLVFCRTDPDDDYRVIVKEDV